MVLIGHEPILVRSTEILVAPRDSRNRAAARNGLRLARSETMTPSDDDCEDTDGEATQQLPHRDKFSAFANDARKTKRFPPFYESWVATKMGPHSACLSELREPVDPTPLPEILPSAKVDDLEFDRDADTLVRS